MKVSSFKALGVVLVLTAAGVAVAQGPVVNIGGNPVSCGILEVGDPEEGFTEDGAVYGAFPYTFNGFTYHLQDLVYLEYFGAPNTTSVDGGAESFHDNPFKLGICNNGG